MKVRKGGGEEIPLVQGKVQQLRFAGAAMKLKDAYSLEGGSPILAVQLHTQNLTLLEPEIFLKDLGSLSDL